MKSLVVSSALAALALAVSACPAAEGEGEGEGGPVAGAEDTHCDGVAPVVTDPAVCDGADGEGEGEGEGEDGDDDYGDTLFNTAGDDDDCKYHVSFTATDVKENDDVTFVVTVTKLADGSAAEGANTRAEVFLDDTHPAPNAGTTTTETAPGVYEIGPVKFDEAGRWTTRFHFYEDCVDSETSQHGHAAFFIDVP